MYKKRLMLIAVSLFCWAFHGLLAQSVAVTGKVVTNTDQKGISGASVQVKGTASGVSTNQEGEFTLSVSDLNVTLVVSSVGFREQEVPLAGRTSITITLESSGGQMGEVVVIGYGTAKKKDLTGAVTQVKPKELTAFPTGSALQSINGRAAGVRVMQNDGTPGATPSIRIRGTNSILGSNEPLYVIDGFPGTPNSLQATDIESMEVLKDASATAIYGSRGANGVVIITTKRGKAGKTQVDYEGSYGLQNPTTLLKLMNNRQWAEFNNEQAANDGLAPYFAPQQLDSISNTASTDWQKLVIHQAPVMLHSLTIGGGNDKTQFSVSANAFLQDGIVRNSGYDRYTLRANLNHNINKIFSISYNTLLSRENTDSKPMGIGSNRGSGLLGAMITAGPALQAYRPDGKLARIQTTYPWLSNVLINPLTVINQQDYKTTTNRQLGNLAFSFKPVDGLVLRIAGGIQNEDSRVNNFVEIDPIINSTGSAAVTSSRITSLLNENTLSYTKIFGDHSLAAVGGFTYQNYITENLSASGTGFLSNLVETYDLQGASGQGIAATAYSKWALLSWLGRVNYSYKGKYLATISFRRDGSSKFSALEKWANFPSAALAWRLSEEPFMKSLSFISSMKIRTSYGASGNNALSPYQTLNALGSSKIVFNDALFTGYGPGTTKPGLLKWETTRSFDIGLDVDFFNRFNLSIDYYQKRTTDLLNSVQLPASTGYISTLQNVGVIENKGWEFAADALLLNGPVNWTINANLSLNRNKVVKLYGGKDLFGSAFFTGPVNDFVNLLREGQPLGIFYGYLEDGYTDNGNLKYKDLNGDGAVNSNDKTYIGNPNPKFIYGINTAVAFKGFELSLFLQGSQGNDIYNLNATQTIDLGFGMNQPVDLYYNHWTADKTKTKYPKISRSLSGNISDRFVEDGSYLRFKNIQLAYTIPQELTKWARNIQLYISAQNMITISNYSWYDPEVNAFGGGNSINQGIDSYGYPTAKTLTFGIRCGF